MMTLDQKWPCELYSLTCFLSLSVSDGNYRSVVPSHFRTTWVIYNFLLFYFIFYFQQQQNRGGQRVGEGGSGALVIILVACFWCNDVRMLLKGTHSRVKPWWVAALWLLPLPCNVFDYRLSVASPCNPMDQFYTSLFYSANPSQCRCLSKKEKEKSSCCSYRLYYNYYSQ